MYTYRYELMYVHLSCHNHCSNNNSDLESQSKYAFLGGSGWAEVIYSLHDMYIIHHYKLYDVYYVSIYANIHDKYVHIQGIVHKIYKHICMYAITILDYSLTNTLQINWILDMSVLGQAIHSTRSGKLRNSQPFWSMSI